MLKVLSNMLLIGVLDSSGLKFTYTSVPPRHRAAILTTGFTTDFTMVIPPEREKYVINSVCSDTCTKQVKRLLFKPVYNNQNTWH